MQCEADQYGITCKHDYWEKRVADLEAEVKRLRAGLEAIAPACREWLDGDEPTINEDVCSAVLQALRDEGGE